MYFIQKIAMTKAKASRSSYIVLLPKGLQRRIASHNQEILVRLANFSRVRYFCPIGLGARCFMLVITDKEPPPNSPSVKPQTTTIQRSGMKSRYVIIPKHVCHRNQWHAGTTLVISVKFEMERPVLVSLDSHGRLADKEEGQEACIIGFQRYQDMKSVFRFRLFRKRNEIAKLESDAFFEHRNHPDLYDSLTEALKYERDNIGRTVWEGLYHDGLVAVSYADFTKLRADMERERKKRRRELARQAGRPGYTWAPRNGAGLESKSQQSSVINNDDDPDAYLESKGDDPELREEVS